MTAMFWNAAAAWFTPRQSFSAAGRVMLKSVIMCSYRKLLLSPYFTLIVIYSRNCVGVLLIHLLEIVLKSFNSLFALNEITGTFWLLSLFFFFGFERMLWLRRDHINLRSCRRTLVLTCNKVGYWLCNDWPWLVFRPISLDNPVDEDVHPGNNSTLLSPIFMAQIATDVQVLHACTASALRFKVIVFHCSNVLQ